VRIAIRNLLRNKLHTFINIIGLTIGFACFITISLWIADEYSYDKSLENRDRIFQLTITHPTGIKDPNVPYLLPVMLADDYAEIQKFTRIIRLNTKITCSFRIEDVAGKHKTFNEENVVQVDTSFFSIFSFPLISGNKVSTLKQPNSIVLNSETAQRFFGQENPIGKPITLNGNQNFIVTGIFDQTGKSHLEFDIVIPIPHNEYNNWNWADPTYILTQEGANLREFRNKIANYFDIHQPYNLKGNFILDILPISKSYLSFGRMKYIYIFSTVALLTLIIAGINYVNLSYAGFSKRMKEMTVRKTAGANRSHLIIQIVSESVILSLIALVFSIIILELILPSFNTLFNRSLQLDLFSPGLLIFIIITVIMVFGLLTGLFPAIFMSGKNLFNKYKSNLKISKFRNYAVISQFVISILLITCSVFILKQLQYIQKLPLGLDPSYIIKVPLNRELGRKFTTYKEELLKNNSIISLSCGQAVPFNEDYKTGGISWRGKDPDSSPMFRYSIATTGLIETFGMNILSGRDFLEDYPSDITNYIVNEEAVRYMGLKNPIGEKITFWDIPGEIVGVVEDFHHVSMHREIMPQIISINPRHYAALKYVFIKISSEKIKETLDYIQSQTLNILPGYAFEFSFIDEEIEDLYRSDQRLAKVIMYFTFITLIICALGVYGITAFLAEQRAKEIGIRKVYGATNSSIVSLFNRKIIRWVIISSIIALPISYGISLLWLNNFAYKTTLSWWVIFLSGFVAIFIGLITSSYETIKAALKDPVKSLRYE
jgi:putative ABC transport system permease protein